MRSGVAAFGGNVAKTPTESCDASRVKKMIGNIRAFITGIELQLDQMEALLGNPDFLMDEVEQIKSSVSDQIAGKLEDLKRILNRTKG